MAIRKDLTSLRWNKNIYYVSNNVIFDISSYRKNPDLDDCGKYLINLTDAPDEIKNAKDGAVLDLRLYPYVFAENVPYMCLKFHNKADSIMKLERYFPLQYLIEKGDMVVDDVVKQAHPAIYGDADTKNKYAQKYYYEVYNYIRSVVYYKDDYDPRNVQVVLNSLPDWLTMDNAGNAMTMDYIDKYFSKGQHYNAYTATKGAEDDSDLYIFDGAFLGVGDEYAKVDVWNEDIIKEALRAIYAERTVNKYMSDLLYQNVTSTLSIENMEYMASVLKDDESDYNFDKLKTFINIGVNDDTHVPKSFTFESVCASDSMDTWYEYGKYEGLDVEKLVRDDLEYVNKFAAEKFGEGADKFYYETNVTVKNAYDSPGEKNYVTKLYNVFAIGLEEKNVTLMIYHQGDTRKVVEEWGVPYVGCNNMLNDQGEITADIVKTFSEAYGLYMGSEYEKGHSRRCVLRKAVMEHGGEYNPQYVFGSEEPFCYVDAKDGTVRDELPPVDNG